MNVYSVGGWSRVGCCRPVDSEWLRAWCVALNEMLWESVSRSVVTVRRFSVALASGHLKLPENVAPRISLRWFSNAPQKMNNPVDLILQNYDKDQIKLMEEECILINEDDIKTGSASKKVCHLWDNIEKGMLHRAFSFFLFNKRGELLLQQRAPYKITYPGHWTNTCCSHPLNFEAELDENNAHGVLCAAQRKLNHELGIAPEEIPLEAMQYLTRIHYKSENVPRDGMWGEHEIDYIIFAQCDVTLRPNSNEVKDVRYVTKDDLQHLIEDSKRNVVQITPWFQLIYEKFLPTWWSNLCDLRPCLDHGTIHRMLPEKEV